jgi:hypothetical protein
VSSPALTRLWSRDWADGEPGPNDLYTLECKPAEDRDLEGEILFRCPSQTAAVLTGFVPCREKGFKFTPILHQAHYNMLDERSETYVVLASLIGEYEDAQGENNVYVEFRDLAGRVAKTERMAFPCNSTWLLPVRKTAEAAGVDVTGGLSLRIRGGASQFAIFTAYLDRETGAIGVEHSLPPIYFSEAPFHPQMRSRYVKAAFGDLP